VLVDLADPAQRDEASLLLPAHLPRGAVCGREEGGDLFVHGGGAGSFPVRRLFPGRHITGLGLAGVVGSDPGDPRLPEDPAWFDGHLLLLGCLAGDRCRDGGGDLLAQMAYVLVVAEGLQLRPQVQKPLFEHTGPALPLGVEGGGTGCTAW
jgi:hypothetical protein